MSSEVEIVQEGVFRVSNVDKSGIKSRHYFFDFSQVEVSHGVVRVSGFRLKRDETPVLGESGVDGCGSYVYNEFAFHLWALVDYGRDWCESTDPLVRRAAFVIPRCSAAGVGAASRVGLSVVVLVRERVSVTILRSVVGREGCLLLIFVAILSQSFFAFVCRHFVSFMLFSVWHIICDLDG